MEQSHVLWEHWDPLSLRDSRHLAEDQVDSHLEEASGEDLLGVDTEDPDLDSLRVSSIHKHVYIIMLMS